MMFSLQIKNISKCQSIRCIYHSYGSLMYFSKLSSTRHMSSLGTQKREALRVTDFMSCWGAPAKLNGGIESLQQYTLPTPTITAPNDVLIKVDAASVNPLDVNMLNGYGDKFFSFQRCVSNILTVKDDSEEDIKVMGRDFTGVVCGKGGSVTSVKLGEQVMGVVEPFNKMGSHAQYVVVPESNVVSINRSDVALAGIPYASLTGYSAAIITGCQGNLQLMNGKCVLVAGAAGGVGVLLVQMLTAWGAQVAGVCSSRNFELLSSFGINELYDYSDTDDMIHLKSLRSFDMVIDCSGRRDYPYLDALKTNSGASYITLLPPLLLNTDEYGLISGLSKSIFDLGRINMGNLNRGRTVKWGFFMPSKTGLKTMKDLLDQGLVQPVTDKIFTYQEGLEAFQHMQDGRHTGKTIITFDT